MTPVNSYRFIVALVSFIAIAAPALAAPPVELANDAYLVRLEPDRSVVVTRSDGASRKFTPRFTILTADTDPKMEMRWGDFGDPAMTLYNVSTWQTKPADKPDAKIDPNAHGGEEKVIDDASYPFEYTVPLKADAKAFKFAIEATTPDGKTQQSEWMKLNQ